MEIYQANWDMLSVVTDITQNTIDDRYPRYYPAGAVEFFKQCHKEQHIKKDLEDGDVFLLSVDGNPIATVTVKENHILRLFVLTKFQHRGYGRQLLDFAENRIAQNHAECVVDASFPAKRMYLNRGYVEKAYHTLRTDNGDYLCYDVMVKELSNR